MFPSIGCGKSSTTLTLAAKDPTPSIFDVLMTATTYKPNINVNNDVYYKLYQIIYHVPILIYNLNLKYYIVTSINNRKHSNTPTHTH